MFAQKTAKFMEENISAIKDEGKFVELILRDGVGAGDSQD
jgi:hypothetical protein